MAEDLTAVGRTVRIVAGLVAAVVALDAAAWLGGRVIGPVPAGPRSSAYATAPEGLAAYADLLVRSGHPVSRVVDPIGRARLDERSTVVVLDPDTVTPQDVVRLRRFVERGGRLVAGGGPRGWLSALTGTPLRLAKPSGTHAFPLAPVAEAEGVSVVLTAAEASFADTGATLGVLGSGGRTVVAVAGLGRGRAVLVADASPLQNRLLGEADNAALGLAIAGEPGRAVSFVESVHGYGAQRLGAVPARWRWFAALVAVAAGVWMIARGRRLGPPQRDARPLPPPRRAFVDAVALALERAERRRLRSAQRGASGDR